jgi:hypothetical protein
VCGREEGGRESGWEGDQRKEELTKASVCVYVVRERARERERESARARASERESE